MILIDFTDGTDTGVMVVWVVLVLMVLVLLVEAKVETLRDSITWTGYAAGVFIQNTVPFLT